MGSKQHQCANCKQTDPRKFYKDNRRASGLQTYCKKCAALKRAAWAKKNPSRIRDYYKEYQKGIRKDPRKWAERIKKETRDAVTVHLAEQVRQNNRRAANMGRQGKLSVKEWYGLIRQHKACPGCKRAWVFAGRPAIDHIRPLILKGENALSNIQPLCKSCNSRKRVSIRSFVEKKRADKTKATSEGRSKIPRKSA